MLKQRFRIAIAAAGITQAAWAKKHMVSEPCLSKLLSGKMTSKRLTNLVNRFVDNELKKMNFLKPIERAA